MAARGVVGGGWVRERQGMKSTLTVMVTSTEEHEHRVTYGVGRQGWKEGINTESTKS